MRNRSFSVSLAFLLWVALSLPSIAHAMDPLIGDPGTVGGGGDRPSQITFTNLGADLARIWTIARVPLLIGLLAAIFIVVAGIKYITAAGDPKKTAEAKQAVLQSVLAVALVMAGSTIISLIWAFFVELAKS
jgi:hypothetical protein